MAETPGGGPASLKIFVGKVHPSGLNAVNSPVMKPAFLLTLCLATFLRAEEPAAEPAPATPAAPRFIIAPAESPLSPAQQQVNAKLPAYNPDAPKEAGTHNTPHPDAIELPKIKVSPKQRPRLTPDIVITNKGLDEKSSPLDGKLLNKFTLPGWMGGQTAADRAREEQQRQRKAALTQDVDTIAKAVEAVDPAQAKALRDAVAKP